MPSQNDAPNIEYLRQRNKELGALLAQVREHQQRSVSECAALLATSRRRYKAIEQGETGVSAAELEVLIQYLKIPAGLVWRDRLPRDAPHQVVVQAQPGEQVQVVVDVQE